MQSSTPIPIGVVPLVNFTGYITMFFQPTDPRLMPPSVCSASQSKWQDFSYVCRPSQPTPVIPSFDLVPALEATPTPKPSPVLQKQPETMSVQFYGDYGTKEFSHDFKYDSETTIGELKAEVIKEAHARGLIASVDEDDYYNIHNGNRCSVIDNDKKVIDYKGMTFLTCKEVA